VLLDSASCSKPRRHAKASIAALSALLAIAGGVQALAPAAAVASAAERTETCVFADGTWVTAGGVACTVVDMGEGETVVIAPTQVKVLDKPPPSPYRPQASPCQTPALCLSGQPSVNGIRMQDDRGQVTQARGGVPLASRSKRGASGLRREFCSRIKEWYDKVKKERDGAMRISPRTPAVEREIEELTASLNALRRTLREKC
jgi:hypothetical protein